MILDLKMGVNEISSNNNKSPVPWVGALAAVT